jgi:hypothetical protein
MMNSVIFMCTYRIFPNTVPLPNKRPRRLLENYPNTYYIFQNIKWRVFLNDENAIKTITFVEMEHLGKKT